MSHKRGLDEEDDVHEKLRRCNAVLGENIYSMQPSNIKIILLFYFLSNLFYNFSGTSTHELDNAIKNYFDKKFEEMKGTYIF